MANRQLKKNVKWIFFDFNKVLADEIGSVKDKANETLGITMEEYNSVSYPIKEYLRKKYEFVKTLDQQREYFFDFYTELVKRLNVTKKADLKEIAEWHMHRKFKLKPNTIEQLEKFQKRYQMGIISNSFPTRREHLRDLGLEKFFALNIISMEEGVVKPETKLFQIATLRAGIFPEEAVYVDDKFHELSGAVKAHYARAYLYAGWRLEELKEYNHVPGVKVIESLADMVKDLC